GWPITVRAHSKFTTTAARRSRSQRRGIGTMNSPGPGATEAAPSDYLSALISSFLGWTLDAFDFFVLIFTIPAIAQDFHRGIPDVAATVAVTLAFRPLGALIFGLMADKYGRRLPMMLDLVFFSVLEVLSGLAPNYAT